MRRQDAHPPCGGPVKREVPGAGRRIPLPLQPEGVDAPRSHAAPPLAGSEIEPRPGGDPWDYRNKQEEHPPQLPDLGDRELRPSNEIDEGRAEEDRVDAREHSACGYRVQQAFPEVSHLRIRAPNSAPTHLVHEPWEDSRQQDRDLGPSLRQHSRQRRCPHPHSTLRACPARRSEVHDRPRT